MTIKNARVAGRAALLALSMLAGLSASGSAGGGPPLEGQFKDNFTLLEPPEPAPRTPFTGPDGEAVRLADFRGRVVLLNFWATWCAPCIRELPTMDRLQAALKDEGLLVVIVSEDRGGLATAQPFLDGLAVTNLRTYADPKGALARDVGLVGLPTTILIDARGRIVGGMEGPAEWDAPEALSLIRHYLRAAQSAAPVEESLRPGH